ncbi:MAG: 16S rRNA (cytosine(967)-C(5))-methyltransferase RsmB [Gammaproteobacteria bacterium]|nr:16S rRNA (cytosine(967)-C(5))-methyltransferase RsmB [Gammaproteobacteria bacterium]MBU1624598.1 16S rRNA (cytosine(967)-C(5))-methyltransferase RsmB [Gammaproteobacteria bacterium]MBU1982442.1 16S rRNA (cytosine(967)-C(5))-methyltransferase RsmB [Gammaproteobacteria bacterium]
MNVIQTEAAGIVQRVMDGCNLDRALADRLAANSDYSPQQRGALQDLSYGTIRYYARLEFMLGKLLDRPPRDKLVSHLLMVALYQLEYSKAGSHVIVDQAVRAAKKMKSPISGLVNAVLRNFLRQQESLRMAADAEKSSRFAYPDWWIKEIEQQYGESSPSILEAGNMHPPMTLRVNRCRTTTGDYLSLLESAGIAAQRVAPEALLLAQPMSVERLPKFDEGWVSVQDAGAQCAAPILDVADGMRVLDMCSAPGGKAMHMLEQADIELVALDKDERRLDRVRQNLKRGGQSAEVICGDASQPATWWDGKLFQRILADVPCSASGVVRRHPDIKWLRRSADIAEFSEQQSRILEAIWPLLASGGKLLYATCSIFKQENQDVVERFLAKHKDANQEALALPFANDPPGQLLPCTKHDGFFYALLRKID